MPWKLQKSEGGYLVVDDKGKKYSKKPMSKSRALRQMRALYSSEGTKEKALTLKEVHTGVMVAWKVPQVISELFKALVERYVGPMYPEQPDDMHMTIAYAGDVTMQSTTMDDAVKAVSEYAKGAQEMYGTLNGFAVFETTHLPDTRAIVALVDVPDLPDFRQGLVSALDDAGIRVIKNHGFTAHITLAYVPKDVWFETISIPTIGIDIDEISLHWGDRIERFELAEREDEIQEPVEKESLTVFKQGDEWRWVLCSSTAYRDRDGEIVSVKALQDDCDRADIDGDYGPLRWWHVDDLDIGDCDFNMVYGKTLVESGTFRSPTIAQATAKEAKNLQVSIGFNHPRGEPDADGVFHKIKRFERSLLPVGRASNPFTAVPAVRKEQDMTSIQDKLKAFSTILKDESAVKAILDGVAQSEKDADAKGTEFKEANEETADQKPCKTEDPGMAAASEESDEEKTEGETDKSVDDGPFVGDLTPDEFGTLMANVITKAFEPVMQSVKELQGEQAKTKEARANETATIVKQMQALEARLKELEGATPAAAKGYVASQATDNIVGEDHRLKDAAPSPDPAGGFFDFALGK